MIRKTFICGLGILAGASTGAYVDGFFERDNAVTRTYQQVANNFSDQGNLAVDNDSLEQEQRETVASDSDIPDSQAVGFSSGSSLKSAAAKVVNSATAATAATGSAMAKAKEKTSKLKDSITSTLTDQELNLDSEKSIAGKDPSEIQKGSSDRSQKDRQTQSSELTSSLSASENDPSLGSETPNADGANDLETISTKSSDAIKQPLDSQSIEEEEEDASIANLDSKFSRETFLSPAGGELAYRKLSPQVVNAGQRLPLVVFLHGSSERGDDNTAQLKHGLDYLASPEGMKEFPATIIAPQCPQNSRWTSLLSIRDNEEENFTSELESTPNKIMRLTQELISSLIVNDPTIDPDRIYVTGLSMGGFGTFDLISRMPSVFAAAVPLCGGGDTRPEIVERIKRIPMWVIHGQKDQVVDAKYSRRVVEALENAGANPRYSELPGFGHNIWDVTYSDEELYKWMFSNSQSATTTTQPKLVENLSGDQSSGELEDLEKSMPEESATDAKSQPKQTASASRQEDTAAEKTASNTRFNGAIVGDWKVLAATKEGRRASPATLAKMEVEIQESKFNIVIGNKNEIAKIVLPKIKDALYPPIDIISLRKGVKDSKGIFAKQGNKLVICWGLPGASRPSSFDSRTGVKTLVLEKQ
jgi:uncharacterized protein (TIGR03067 family)